MPSNWAALFTFIIFALPGIFQELLRERSIPRPKETAFREIGRAIFVSLLAAFPGTLGAASGWLLASPNHLGANYTRILKWDLDYAGSNVLPLISAIVGYLILSMLSVWAWEEYRYAQITADRPAPQAGTVLPQVFEKDAEKNIPFAQVNLSSGAVWMGQAQYWTHQTDNGSNTEIVLSAPIEYKPPKGKRRDEPHLDRVILTGDKIDSIAVLYNTPQQESPELATSEPAQKRPNNT